MNGSALPMGWCVARMEDLFASITDGDHQPRVDLVDVVEAHDDVLLDALRLRRLLCREPEADHASSS